jgi:hypothetical protein
MNQNYSTVSVAAPAASQPLAKVTAKSGSDDSLCYEFQVHGVGRGTFSCSGHFLNGNNTESVLLESLVWNGKVIKLNNFPEHSLCFEQGKLLGLNLLGEGWEILLNLGIQINSVHRITEVTYQLINPSASVYR